MDKTGRITGIVCEYNPFHNGHFYQLQNAKKNENDAVVAVMSGNFTQRGEAALFSKHTRARAALLNGADLVVELPLSFAVSGAERFAFGAVYLLNAMGCVDEINFGSECGDIEKLAYLAEILNGKEIYELTSGYMASGVTFAAARQKAAEKLCGKDAAELLSSANNTLGIEYIRAAKRLDSKIAFSTIKREGAAHDSDAPVGKTASASFIRDKILSGDLAALGEFVPQRASELYGSDLLNKKAPHSVKYSERAVLDRLRRMTAEDWAKVPDVSEGLHNRIYDAVRKSCSISEIFSQIKTKRYTLARIRRIILSGYLGISSDNIQDKPKYIRVLGMNDRGIEVLREIKKSGTLRASSSLAEIKKFSDEARISAELESASTDLYMLMCEKVFSCGIDYTEPVIVVRK